MHWEKKIPSLKHTGQTSTGSLPRLSQTVRECSWMPHVASKAMFANLGHHRCNRTPRGRNFVLVGCPHTPTICRPECCAARTARAAVACCLPAGPSHLCATAARRPLVHEKQAEEVEAQPSRHYVAQDMVQVAQPKETWLWQYCQTWQLPSPKRRQCPRRLPLAKTAGQERFHNASWRHVVGICRCGT